MRLALPPLLAVVLLTAIGCAIKYRYPLPSESEARELEALTVLGLEADTGTIPTALPPGPFEAPLKYEHDRYFVPSRLNGKKADLMLDWGSWVTVGLLPRAVRSVQARLSDSMMATRTLDGEGEMRTGVLDELEIAGRTFRDVAFAMSNRDLKVTFGGMTVYRGIGMFGLVIPAGYTRFAVDLANRRMYFGSIPAPLLESDEAVTLPVRIDEGLWVNASLDGMPIRLKIDIGGYSGGVLLEGQAAEAYMRARPSRFAGHSTGFGDSARASYRVQGAVVALGNHVRDDVSVKLLPSEGGDRDPSGGRDRESVEETNGLLGHGFFGRTVVGVDLDRRILIFLPIP
jgi:hypothetical protein